MVWNSLFLGSCGKLEKHRVAKSKNEIYFIIVLHLLSHNTLCHIRNKFDANCIKMTDSKKCAHTHTTAAVLFECDTQRMVIIKTHKLHQITKRHILPLPSTNCALLRTFCTRFSVAYCHICCRKYLAASAEFHHND